MPDPRRASGVHVTEPMPAEQGGFWSRLFGGTRPQAHAHAQGGSGRTIRIEVRQMDRTVNVEWPVEAADQCRDWLRELVKTN